MSDDNIVILKGTEVNRLLAAKELDLIDIVRSAYESHAAGKSALPHSTFLRFPESPQNRIIALPAYLSGDFKVAGVKWVSSFPGNLQKGLDRASAALILNSTATGRPVAFIEGSIISAKRTAASAALAAQFLLAGSEINRLGLLGCGLINFEIVRFLLAILPQVKSLIIFDINASRAAHFRKRCLESFELREIDVAAGLNELLSSASLLSFATTASSPHIFDLSVCAPATIILHVSLRDLSPELILSCDNIVDDIDHVCRAETSLHLAEQLTGNRGFIRCSVADIISGKVSARRDEQSVAIFSPFGLGVLDIAVAKHVYDLARRQNIGTVIESFLPSSWASS